jgi:small subunit ribosomal protein S7
MRRRRPERRTILPDSVYEDLKVAKFINYLMDRGKKGVAEKIFYDAMEIVKTKTKSEGIKVFEQAIKNVSPMLEVKSKRIGGATYQVPIEVPRNRQFYLSSHWLITAAVGRKGIPMAERMASELIAASNNEGGAVKKKEDTHRMAEANKAFAHFGRARR